MRDAANPLLRPASWEEVQAAEKAEEASARKAAAGAVFCQKTSWNMAGGPGTEG